MEIDLNNRNDFGGENDLGDEITLMKLLITLLVVGEGPTGF
jgi:hypothetical protein